MRPVRPLLLAVALACGDTTDPGDDPVPTDQVEIVDNAYRPANIIVGEGQLVMWEWNGTEPHTVTFDDPLWTDSAIQLEGGIHEITFTIAGRYTYFCAVHGRSVMSGSVEVTPQEPEPIADSR